MVTAMQSIPFSEARAHLAETLRLVESSQNPLLISRRGQDVGVLMSIEQYQQLATSPSSFSARLNQWRTTYAQSGLNDDPFNNVRDTSKGREFSW